MTFRTAILAILLVLSAPAVKAQAFRAYLSLNGNDANPCTRTEPCRLLPAALAAVQSGGEVWMLDSANYNTGPVNVDKPVTILAVPGVLGSVVALGGNALDITTTGAVTLRNVNIHPFPGNAGFSGVTKATTGALLIQDSTLFGFTDGSAAAVRILAKADVTITRSVFRDNRVGVEAGNEAQVGISDALFTGHSYAGVFLTTPAATASLSRTVARANRRAVYAWGNALPSHHALRVVDSQVECSSREGTAGIEMLAVAGATGTGTVAQTAINGCEQGFVADGAGLKAFLSRNTLSDNSVGVYQGSALVETDGTNAIHNNTTNVFGSLTGVGAQ